MHTTGSDHLSYLIPLSALHVALCCQVLFVDFECQHLISDRSHGRALVKNQLLSLLIVYLFLLILLLMDRL